MNKDSQQEKKPNQKDNLSYKLLRKSKVFLQRRINEVDNRHKVPAIEVESQSSAFIRQSNPQDYIHPATSTRLQQTKKNSSSDFSRTQLFDYKKIQQCKSTIQSIVQKITLQNKKNHLLRNLVQLMNQQMISIKEQSKRNEHEQFQQQSKVIKRLNYDIDKTLQKNNQEIANLYRLKQEINAKRSERVVFSNLFRKIQMQLKNATNLYVETIIKSETSKNQTIYLQSIRSYGEEGPLTERNHVLKESQQGSQERNMIRRDSQDRTRTDSSVMKKRKFKQQKNIGSRFITQHNENHDHFQHIQKRISLINNQIYQMQFQIKRLLQATGCEDFDEAELFVSTVQCENKRLQEELEEMTKKAEELQFEQRKIIMQRKNAEIIEQAALPKSRTRIKNAKSGKVIEAQQQQQLTNQEILQQLLTVFNLHDQNTGKFIENASLMDQKLDILIKLFPNTSRPTTTQRQKLQRETNQSSAGSERQALPPLNVILDRVEPVGDSEKLYEKSWFLDAYQKELKKFNKKEHKKK